MSQVEQLPLTACEQNQLYFKTEKTNLLKIVAQHSKPFNWRLNPILGIRRKPKKKKKKNPNSSVPWPNTLQ